MTHCANVYGKFGSLNAFMKTERMQYLRFTSFKSKSEVQTLYKVSEYGPGHV